MGQPIRILLQTTIPATEDDWGIERFSRLHQYLVGLADDQGQPLLWLPPAIGRPMPGAMTPC